MPDTQWDKLRKRILSKGREQRGYALVTIKVVVDSEGNPIMWFEPDMKRIEPCQSGARLIATLISGLDMGA
jgi:hypothetical protein